MYCIIVFRIPYSYIFYNNKNFYYYAVDNKNSNISLVLSSQLNHQKKNYSESRKTTPLSKFVDV